MGGRGRPHGSRTYDVFKIIDILEMLSETPCGVRELGRKLREVGKRGNLNVVIRYMRLLRECGLVELGSDGKYALSEEGRKLLHALAPIREKRNVLI